MANVLKAVEEVANEKLPMNSKKEGTDFKGKKKLPEWKKYVDPVKDTAHFWHAIWKSAGKPINCHLHTIMKKTRNRYHLIIRKKRRLLERMKRDNMLQSCLENDGNIFDDIKRQRKCKQTFSTTIDEDTDDIPEYLADKYEGLYNGVDDKDNLVKLEHELKEKIDDHSITFVDRVTTDVVKNVTKKKLKPGKTDAVANITPDYLIHAPDKLFEILSICFKSYSVHAQ